MICIDYSDFLKVTNMSETSFKKRTKQEKIKCLESKGYIVKEINGIGTKAIFYCLETDDLKLKKELEQLLKVEVKYPKVMNEYLKLICSENDNFYLSRSDGEIATTLTPKFDYKFNTLKKYLSNCRLELTECGWMKPIVTNKMDKNATKRRYVIKDKETNTTKDIDCNEFLDNYRDIYYPEIQRLTKSVIKTQKITNTTDKQRRQICGMAKNRMEEVLNGKMYFVYIKEFKIGGFTDE